MKYNIYMFDHPEMGIIYIGRTRESLKRRKQKGYKGTVVENLYKECDMILIEETDDVSRERYWIDHYTNIGIKLLNGNRGETGMSRTQLSSLYYIENKEGILHRVKNYKCENKDKVKSYMKKYQSDNKDRLNAYQREYRQRQKAS